MAGAQSGSNSPNPFPARAVDQTVFVCSEKLVAGGAILDHLRTDGQFALSISHTLYGATACLGLVLEINQWDKFVPICGGLIGIAAYKVAV